MRLRVQNASEGGGGAEAQPGRPAKGALPRTWISRTRHFSGPREQTRSLPYSAPGAIPTPARELGPSSSVPREETEARGGAKGFRPAVKLLAEPGSDAGLRRQAHPL